MKLKTLFFIIFSLLTINLVGQQQDIIAITIDGEPVYRSEIVRAYQESNAVLQEKEPFDEFLSRFVEFKLNIKEAKNQHIDKDEAFVRECSNFKISRSDTYLRDTTATHLFLKDIYAHLLEEREVNHVMIPFGQSGLFPSDTLELYKKALSLRDNLIKNNFTGEDYTTKQHLRTDIAFDLQSQNGYLGWIAPFMFSYPVENTIYHLDINEVSMPVRSAKGYHIVQLLNKRPARGQSRIQQVHYTFSEIPPTQHQIDSVRPIVENAYSKIRSTQDYDILCDNYAKAYGLGDKGCEFGLVSVESKMPPSFIDAVYGLQKPGDISKPVMTDYGFHILRLMEIVPLPSYDFLKQQIFSKVRFGDRLFYLNKANNDKLRKDYNFSINTKTYNQLYALTETLSPNDDNFIKKMADMDEILFSVDGAKSYKVKDFAVFLQKIMDRRVDEAEVDPTQIYDNSDASSLSSDLLDRLFDIYSSNEVKAYAKLNIDKRFPDFKNQMKRYEEELLLFYVKDKNIWKRASSDEKGLAKYFETHKKEYTWNSLKYRGLIVFCKDEKTLEKAKQLSAKKNDLDELSSSLRKNLNEDIATVQIEKGIWSEGENEYIDNKVFSGAAPEERKGFPLFFVTGKLLSSPQTFNDDRARVEADYQVQLEKEWSGYLKNKYKVTTNTNVLKDIE